MVRIVEKSEREPDWLTVPEMARELGISQEKVRTWCRTGRIGALNIGDQARSFFRVRRDEWERFKERRTMKLSPVTRLLPRRGTNLLGI